MDLGAIETLIQGQVKAALGFDDGHVIWANQTRNRPSRPFVELFNISSANVSPHTEFTQADNPESDGEDGEELLLSAIEQVSMRIEVRVFSSAVTGSNKAFNLAQKIRSHFGKEAAVNALGDVAVINRENVQDVSIVLETEHEGRAVFTMTFGVANVEEETATYIEEAVIKTTIPQKSGDVENTITVALGDD